MMLAVGHDQGIRFRDDHFLLASVRFAGRHGRAAWRNALTDASLRYLRKHSLRQMLVGKVNYRHGYNLDPEVQILLGAETGLRGYPLRQFAGNRSLLLSVEERWFVTDDLGQLLSLGVAGFVDSGFVWTEFQPVNLTDLKTGVGLSLLLGSNRLSSRSGVRIDVGYGLNSIAGAPRWVFAAGSDLTF
jgi:hemolysin activation/secretion protein